MVAGAAEPAARGSLPRRSTSRRSDLFLLDDIADLRAVNQRTHHRVARVCTVRRHVSIGADDTGMSLAPTNAIVSARTVGTTKTKRNALPYFVSACAGLRQRQKDIIISVLSTLRENRPAIQESVVGGYIVR